MLSSSGSVSNVCKVKFGFVAVSVFEKSVRIGAGCGNCFGVRGEFICLDSASNIASLFSSGHFSEYSLIVASDLWEVNAII